MSSVLWSELIIERIVHLSSIEPREEFLQWLTCCLHSICSLTASPNGFNKWFKTKCNEMSFGLDP
jgi:hypothetical protein